MNIQNYGFTKTLVQQNGHYSGNEMKWQGDYDGNVANIDININDNGISKHVSMQLDNNDLAHMLGIQPINIPLEQRLMNDFLSYPKTRTSCSKYNSKSKYKSKSRKYRRPYSRKRVSKKRYKPLLIEGALYPKYQI
jgi:hypothetical protein